MKKNIQNNFHKQGYHQTQKNYQNQPHPRTLNTYEEALAKSQPILEEWIHHIQKNPDKVPQGPLNAPWHIHQTDKKLPWEMSVPALKNTLHYIMNHVHHPCYLFCCALNGKRFFYKLETHETSPLLKQYLKDLPTFNIDSLERKKKLMEEIKQNKQTYRIMQCIVKPFSSGFSDEYDEWTKKWPFPPGVYILNLSDVILLRKDFQEPFPNAFIGKKVNLPYNISSQPFIPIMSLSGHVDYWDIPIPTYDDMMYTFPSKKIQAENDRLFEKVTTDFFKKPFHRVVFRGSTTGCGVTPETNSRLRLIEHAKGPDMEIMDVGFVSSKKSSKDRGKMKLDPLHGFAVAYEPTSVKDHLPLWGQSYYRYIFHVDGNVLAYRLLFSMLSGSLIFRVKSPYQSFVDVTQMLQPGVHYLEVKADLSNVRSLWNWCEKNPQEAGKIAKAGMDVAKEILTPKFLHLYLGNIFQMYSQYQTLQGGLLKKVKSAKRRHRNQPKRTTRSTRKRRLSS